MDHHVTGEECDAWYRASGGDPWGTNSPLTLARHTNSLEFIQQYVSQDFEGLFVEIGAFNGEFTARLAAAYPLSNILANDISGVALDAARDRLSSVPNVSFVLSDMANFVLPPDCIARPAILLILDSLYYMPDNEQEAVLGRLLSEVRDAKTVFISGPMRRGGDYFEEKVLRGWFDKNGLEFVSAKTLNTNEKFRSLHSFHGDWFIAMLEVVKRFTMRYVPELTMWRIGVLNRRQEAALRRLDTGPAYRKRYAHQVIYCFQR